MVFVFIFWRVGGGVMNLNASSFKGANNVPESSVDSCRLLWTASARVFSCAFHIPLFNSIPTITVGELSHFHC